MRLIGISPPSCAQAADIYSSPEPPCSSTASVDSSSMRNQAEPRGTRRNHHQMTPSDNFGILRGPVLKARTFILRQRLHARALHRQDPNIMRNQAEPGGTRRNHGRKPINHDAKAFPPSRERFVVSFCSKYQLFAVDPRQRPPSAPVQYGIGSSNSNSIIHPTQDNTGSTAVQIPKPRGLECSFPEPGIV